MGLISAVVSGAVSSVTGTLVDSYKEVIEPADMTGALCVRGYAMKKGKRVTGETADYITNGSIIHVYPNTIMLLVDGGKIVDYCAQEGYYTVNSSTAPSLFNGELSETLQETWKRFQFGGITSSKQLVYYINTAEIKGIKFGTRNPVNYFDSFYNAELFLRAHGSYSIKITDPIKFFVEFVTAQADRVMISDLTGQLFDEFMEGLSSAINRMSVDGIRISNVASQATELSSYMSTALDEKWRELRGIEICSVGIASVSYDEESKNLINLRNRGAMMSDPTVREGYVQSAVAEGLKSAGSNTSGAANAYMAMGVGMNGAGNFMASASATNSAQMAAQQTANKWQCSCGATNEYNFCSSCGSKKPEPQADNKWQCSCGASNKAEFGFCTNCGTKRPVSDEWTCSCGTVNNGKFCGNCGSAKA